MSDIDGAATQDALKAEIKNLKEAAKAMETSLIYIKLTIFQLEKQVVNVSDDEDDVHPFLVETSTDEASDTSDQSFITLPDIAGNRIYVGSKVYCVTRGKYRERYGRAYFLCSESGMVYLQLLTGEKTHRSSDNLRVVYENSLDN